MILEILQYPDPRLKVVSERVPDGAIPAELLRLGGNMRDTMLQRKAIGISAVQVGTPVRMVVLSRRCGIPYAALFNPELQWLGGARMVEAEGCLSIDQGKSFFKVERNMQCAVTFTTSQGLRKAFRCSGLTARLLQHELDHLDGITIVDRFNERAAKANGSAPGAQAIKPSAIAQTTELATAPATHQS